MTLRRSLSFQLSVSLLTALVLLSLAYWPIAFALFGRVKGVAQPNFNWYAERPVRESIVASILRGEDGSFSISATNELQAASGRMSALRYAAFDPKSGAALSGSSAELAAALRRFIIPLLDADSVRPLSTTLNFQLPGRTDLYGNLAHTETPFGTMLVATYGFQFEWSDLSRVLTDALWLTAAADGLVFCCGALFVWFAIRRGLDPLRVAADRARAIDMDSLQQRLPEEDMPAEVAPFVRAMNEALERLRAGVERQRRFVANAAHQLCTPIAILRARIDDPLDEDLRRDMRRDTRRLQAIVEQLLVSARFADCGGEATETFDFADVVRAKVADYAPLMRENRRCIDFEGPSTKVMLRGDRRALESVVANLVDNAMHAEPEGGTIVVRLGDEAELVVVDHGEGVAEADRALIFEPFWRKSEARPGTGLGLAIVKELVERHDGRIGVEPTPGGGATFRVALAQVLAK